MDFYGTGQSGTVTNDQDAQSVALGPGQNFVLIAANGTLKGTLNFEGSADGTNWAAVQVLNPGTGTVGSTAAVDGSGGAIVTAWSANVSGFTNVRARLHPTTSGSATVTLRVGSVPQAVTGINTLAAGSNLIGTVEVADSGGTNKLGVNASGQITTVAAVLASADGATTANVPEVQPGLFNGTTSDRQRGNVDTAALITASGATTTQTGVDQTNYNGRGLIVVFDMTVNAGNAGSVTLTIQGKDAASGKYYTLLAGAAVTSVATNVYTVYPGNTVAANVSASTALPRTWRVLATANNANATSYTVGASVIV